MISFRLSAAGIFFLTLPACTPMIDTHGDALDSEALASLQPGKTSYMEVQAKLGSPSSRAVLTVKTGYIFIPARNERLFQTRRNTKNRYGSEIQPRRNFTGNRNKDSGGRPHDHSGGGQNGNK